MAEFFTTLLMTHDDHRRHAALDALEELGFNVVGANTDDDPRSMAVGLVMRSDGE